MVVINVESSYNQYSRFDVVVMCAGFDGSQQQLYLEAAHKKDGQTRTTLEAPEAHHIELLIYFIPRTLPGHKNSDIVDHPPFDVEIGVSSAKRELHCKTHKINAWGGATVKLELEI